MDAPNTAASLSGIAASLAALAQAVSQKNL
jgi:hypothetical protein